MLSYRVFAATAALLVSAPAVAQDVKVAIGISGWTGFAPLTLANQAGIFKKNGLDVTIKKIPQKGPPSGRCIGRHPVCGDHGRNLDFMECQWRCDQADLPARQELRR
jgi:hypothetical protein